MGEGERGSVSLGLSPYFSYLGGGEIVVVRFGLLVMPLDIGGGGCGGIEGPVDALYLPKYSPRVGRHRVGHLVSEINDYLLLILGFVRDGFALLQQHFIHFDLVYGNWTHLARGTCGGMKAASPPFCHSSPVWRL